MPKWTPLIYAPNSDTSWEATPGALITCSGFVPTRRWTYVSWNCQSVVHSYTSAVQPVASGIVRFDTGAADHYIFNKQSVYRSGSNPATASDISSTAYSASTVGWDWTTFGASLICTNYYNAIQTGGLGGSLSNLTGSPPKAQCIETFFGLIVLGNYDDGTATPDGWYCSDIEDPTDWVITSTNFADKGRLYDTPGPIRSLLKLRDSLIAYKDDSIYIGEFVGDPNTTILAWRLISDKVGCSALHGVATLNDRHYFLHRTGAYVFDGSAVRQIGNEVVSNVFDSLAGAGIDFTKQQATVDARENSVFFGLAAAGQTELIRWIVYNAETGRWGGCDRDVFTNASSASAFPTCVVQCTMSDLIACYSTLASVTTLSTAVLCGPDSTGKVASFYSVYGLTPTSARGNSILTGVLGGDGDTNITLTRIKPRFYNFIAGATPICGVYSGKDESLNTLIGSTPVTFTWNPTEFCFDGHASGRYHMIEIVMDNGCEIAGMSVDGWSKPSGKR